MKRDRVSEASIAEPKRAKRDPLGTESATADSSDGVPATSPAPGSEAHPQSDSNLGSEQAVPMQTEAADGAKHEAGPENVTSTIPASSGNDDAKADQGMAVPAAKETEDDSKQPEKTPESTKESQTPAKSSEQLKQSEETTQTQSEQLHSEQSQQSKQPEQSKESTGEKPQPSVEPTTENKQKEEHKEATGAPKKETEPAKPATGFSSFSKGFGGFGGFSSFGGSSFKSASPPAANPWAEKPASSNPWAEPAGKSSDDTGTESSASASSETKTKSGSRQHSEDADVYAQVTLEKQDVKTGEENEEAVHQVRIRLYAIDLTSSDKAWKERGVGLLKLNRTVVGKVTPEKESFESKFRLVLRTDGVLKVKLNLPLLPNMQVTKGFESSLHTDKFVRVAGLENGKAHQFAMRCGSEAARDELYEAIAAAIGHKEEA